MEIERGSMNKRPSTKIIYRISNAFKWILTTIVIYFEQMLTFAKCNKNMLNGYVQCHVFKIDFHPLLEAIQVKGNVIFCG